MSGEPLCWFKTPKIRKIHLSFSVRKFSRGDAWIASEAPAVHFEALATMRLHPNPPTPTLLFHSQAHFSLTAHYYLTSTTRDGELFREVGAALLFYHDQSLTL